MCLYVAMGGAGCVRPQLYRCVDVTLPMVAGSRSLQQPMGHFCLEAQSSVFL